jgi:hypothetical protein
MFIMDLVQALLMECASGMERQIPGRQTLDKKEKYSKDVCCVLQAE